MQNKKKILVVKLGQQRDEKSYDKLNRRFSKLFDVTVAGPLKLNASLKEKADEKTEIYDTDALATHIQNAGFALDEYDLVLGCIDRPHNSEDGILAEVSKDIERNKYYILCTTNIMERLNEGKVSLINFLLNIIYGMYTRKYLGIDPEYHESPGCLLDYCFLERDLIMGCVKPTLCEDCTAGVTDQETAEQMNKELKNIRVPLYIRLIEKIKQRTLLSMIIAVVISFFFGVLSNLIAVVVLAGSFWQGVITSVVPLVILCFLMMPFIASKRKRIISG
jgi:hypothetical protein